MKIDRILFCLNDNPTYTGFWNINSKIWKKKYNVTPTLFFVGNEAQAQRLNLSDEHGEIFVLPYLGDQFSNGSKRNWTITWALFYGATFFPEEICMTSGIDQIPLCDRVSELISNLDNEKYVVGFSDAYHRNDLFPSSHHISKGKYFKNIYNILDSWPAEIEKIYNSRNKYNSLAQDNWGLDEAYSSEFLVKNKLNNVILVQDFFMDWSRKRLDRDFSLKYDLNLLKNGYYSEMHSPRPYENYKEAIDKIIHDCHEL